MAKKAAKKKQKQETQNYSLQPTITMEELRARQSQSIRAKVQAMREETGNMQIFEGRDIRLMDVGIKLVSLAVERLLQSTVLQLQQIFGISGAPGSFKSAFTFEILRWFIQNGGTGDIIDSENKISWSFVESVVNTGADGFEGVDFLSLYRVGSMEEWQSYLQNLNRWKKREMQGTESQPGYGKVAPYLQIVDSVMAKSTEEAQEKIERDGYAGRAYATEAGSITKFLRKYPKDLQNWPFLVLMVNHLKEGTNPVTGQPTYHLPGGRHLLHQYAYELRLKCIKRGGTKDYNMAKIQISCPKNALGDDNIRIEAPVIWWHEPSIKDDPNSQYVQRTVWDWHTATTLMLLSLQGREKEQVEEVLDLHNVPNRGNKGSGVWSEALGIPRKDSLSYREFGEFLSGEEEMLNKLRGRLGITIGKPFQPCVDFDAQIYGAREENQRRVAEAMQLSEPAKDGKTQEDTSSEAVSA